MAINVRKDVLELISLNEKNPEHSAHGDRLNQDEMPIVETVLKNCWTPLPKSHVREGKLNELGL